MIGALPDLRVFARRQIQFRFAFLTVLWIFILGMIGSVVLHMIIVLLHSHHGKAFVSCIPWDHGFSIRAWGNRCPPNTACCQTLASSEVYRPIPPGRTPHPPGDFR